MAYQSIDAAYESISQCCDKFGKLISKNLREKFHKKSDRWFLDETFLTIDAKLHYLWTGEQLIKMVK
ncbi:MAG: hypothetical protein GQ546_02415 [Gammaproteobacteria bacterium]|nr:hypothetical protein [Gammaproteobacteria bacterium]